MVGQNAKPKPLIAVPLIQSGLSQSEIEKALPVYVDGLEGGGGGIPSGTERQVVGYDSTGKPVPTTLGWAQLSDQPTPPPFAAGVLTMARIPTTDIDEFGLVELGLSEDSTVSQVRANAIAIYDPTTGALRVKQMPLEDDEAASKHYADEIQAGVSGELEAIRFDVGDQGMRISAMAGDVTLASSTGSNALDLVNALSEQVAALELRVAALEGAGG